MRRKYPDCERDDGNCTACALTSYGRDCHNRPITKLEWTRRAAEMTQSELSKRSGVSGKQIQKLEAGEINPGNMTAKNLIALADALGVDARDLI